MMLHWYLSTVVFVLVLIALKIYLAVHITNVFQSINLDRLLSLLEKKSFRWRSLVVALERSFCRFITSHKSKNLHGLVIDSAADTLYGIEDIIIGRVSGAILEFVNTSPWLELYSPKIYMYCI